MPDRRHHRGPHPHDQQLFSAAALPSLAAAVADLVWLLSRGYAIPSSLKLVGDRHALDARQRLAVARSACSDNDRRARQTKLVAPEQVAGQSLWIDGFNVLTTVEAALSGGVILLACDGCFRDMASMHGSYRKVAETGPALEKIGACLQTLRPHSVRWLLDQPVSNSGRLKLRLEELAAERHWPWTVELVRDPDAELVQTDAIVASADSQVIGGAACWLNLARLVVETQIPAPWIVDLSV